ncbi:hypothetical protein DIPPA_14284 [Diplonema papillatum]|nr:hypothetical protein DIPPA_14284 [Diplonema papillatum]
MSATRQLFVVAAAALTAGEHTVYISEYVEGQGRGEALEVSNRGASPVDLALYSLAHYPGSNVGYPRAFVLNGTLAPGESRVYANPKASGIFDYVVATAVVELGLDYHGSDPVALRYNGSIIDLVGTFPMYGPWLQKMALRRHHAAALNPAGFPSIPSAFVAGWQWFPENTFDGLGCEGLSACPDAAPVDGLP